MGRASPVAGGGAGAALPALALAFNAFVWGVSWWPLRQLHQAGLHPLWATAGVYVLSIVALLALRPRAPAQLLAHPALWLLALASGMTNVGFNWAVTIGDVVRAVLLFYLMPAWATLLGWAILRERPTAGSLGRLVLALAGVVVVLDTQGTGIPLPHTLADALALAGGFSFALTNILLRHQQAAPPPARILAMFVGGALLAATTAVVGGWNGLVAAPSLAPGQPLVVGAALALAFLLANVALQFGASRLSAQTTALVMLSEVVFASVSSAWLGEIDTSTRTWVGGALIVATAAWSAASQARN